METRLSANLHTHTRRCRHAADLDDRAWVEAALAAGIRVLGFSDHCPWPRVEPLPPPGFRSGVRMDPEETAGYVESLLALREEYKGRIDIRIGFEVEHALPPRIAAQDALFAPFPVDYLICGQHYLGDGSDEWKGDWSGSPTQDESRLEAYVARCLDAMASGRYLYLAHPDVLNYVGPDDVYGRHMSRLCEWLAAHDSPVEVNLLGIHGKRHYPSERFLRIAADCGCKAVLGVDAHDPARLLDPVPEAEARAMCARAGLPVVEADV